MRSRASAFARILAAAATIGFGGCAASGPGPRTPEPPRAPVQLIVQYDAAAGTIDVRRAGEPVPVLTQHARPDHRPYIHPLVAPDGRGVLTEDRPAHHPHQTGLYWGFARLNGRDYFHNPGGDH
jgi:hypothetical protein